MKALPTKTIDLEKMGYHLSAKDSFNFFGYLLRSAEFKILDFSASYANEVMVMVGIMAVIIIKLTVGMNNLHNDFAMGKFFEIPVNSWKTNPFKS
jgi:hypothetical protein